MGCRLGCVGLLQLHQLLLDLLELVLQLLDLLVLRPLRPLHCCLQIGCRGLRPQISRAERQPHSKGQPHQTQSLTG